MSDSNDTDDEETREKYGIADPDVVRTLRGDDDDEDDE
jgi:hypothetical protein